MSRGVSKPRGVPGKIAQAVAIHEAEPGLSVNAIAERCGISRSSVVKGLAAHAARQAYQRREYDAESEHATGPDKYLTLTRLTEPQIAGLDTWLQQVDPAEPVAVPKLVIDAVQALIEEARDRRAAP